MAHIYFHPLPSAARATAAGVGENRDVVGAVLNRKECRLKTDPAIPIGSCKFGCSLPLRESFHHRLRRWSPSL